METPLNSDILPEDEPRGAGPYRFLDVLGKGSGGVVYRAEHRETGARVALKTIVLPHGQQLEILRREILALARVRHPGVVRILDHGVEGGIPWYAMTLVRGTHLMEHTHAARAPGPIPPNELTALLSLVSGLCSTLAYLHGEGIIHRDLKPRNVIVRPDGFPVLVDFGLVSRFGGRFSREVLDIGANVAGTVAYMAPEQVRGELVDARSDLYALGCILFELLTGQPPFGGSSVREILRQHLRTTPRAPSELRSGVPPELDRLVLRLLEKEPQDRLGYATDVAAALVRLGAKPQRPHAVPRARSYLYRSRFVGRDRLLRRLEDRLQTLDSGGGALLFLGGESGVGKTRLALELAQRAERSHLRVLTGESTQVMTTATGEPARGGTPLQPLRPVLRAIADQCRVQGPETSVRLIGDRASVLALYEPALIGLPGLPEPAERPELPPQDAQRLLFRCLTETLAALAQDSTLLLILDDLHWADELTFAFLRHLQAPGTLSSLPLLLVGTYRSDEAPPPLAELVDAAEDGRIRLDRLGEEGIGAMIGDMLALTKPPSSLVRPLARHSEGNPFFLAEYLRAAVTEKLLARDEAGHWKLTEAADGQAAESSVETLPLPRSLQELVGRRLQGLSPSAREVAEVAAVLGREINPRLLEQTAGMATHERLEATQELLSGVILEETAPGLFRFTHDKFREAAHSGLGEARRCELHRAAAVALESSSGPKPDDLYAVLGRHWEEAREPEKARAAYLHAAREAGDRYASHDAEALYLSSLALLHEPTAESVTVRLELAEKVYSVLGQSDESIGQQSQALLEAKTLKDRQGQALALQGLGRSHWMTGRMVEARTYYAEALALHREMGDRREEGRTLGYLGALDDDTFRKADARRHYEQALVIHREFGDVASEALTLSNLAGIYWGEGDLEKASKLCEHALAGFRKLRDRRLEGTTLLRLGLVRSTQNRLAEARQMMSRATAIHKELGDRRWEGISISFKGDLELKEGNIEAGAAHYREALSIQREVDDRHRQGHTLQKLASVERRRGGNLERALAQALEGEALLKTAGGPGCIAICVCEQGHILLARGQSAEQQLERAEALATTETGSSDVSLDESLDRLQKAQAAFAAQQALFRGERLQDLPTGWEAWLQKTRQL